jgi:hypothetical protein
MRGDDRGNSYVLISRIRYDRTLIQGSFWTPQ